MVDFRCIKSGLVLSLPLSNSQQGFFGRDIAKTQPYSLLHFEVAEAMPNVSAGALISLSGSDEITESIRPLLRLSRDTIV